MASIPQRWQRPKPDPEVIRLLELVKEAVERGQVRAIAIVTIDPMLNVETSKAGDIDLVRKRLLAAGLIEISHTLLNDKQ